MRLLFPSDNLRQSVKKISFGRDHVALLLWTGDLYTGGIDNQYYALGRRIPSNIMFGGLNIFPLQLVATNVIDIETGEYSTYYLNDKYQLFGVGKLVFEFDTVMSLNDIDNDDVDPSEWQDQMTKKFTHLKTRGKYILKFFATDNYYCYISSDSLSDAGDLYVNGYLYQDEEDPTKDYFYFWDDTSIANVTNVHGNLNHIGYVTSNGNAYMFGFNDNGTFGRSTNSRSRLSFVIHENIKSIYCGPNVTVLITDDNTMLRSLLFDEEVGYGFKAVYDDILAYKNKYH